MDGRMDDVGNELRVLSLEIRAGFAEVRASIAEVRTAVTALTDLRNEFSVHTHEDGEGAA